MVNYYWAATWLLMYGIWVQQTSNRAQIVQASPVSRPGPPAWTKLFRQDTEVHVVRGIHNIYLCVNGRDRFILNRPSGARRTTEKRRLEAKYTKAGYRTLLQKCYYYIVRKKWKIGNRPVIQVIGQRKSRQAILYPTTTTTTENYESTTTVQTDPPSFLVPLLRNQEPDQSPIEPMAEPLGVVIAHKPNSQLILPMPTFAHDRDWGNGPFSSYPGRPDPSMLHVLKPIMEEHSNPGPGGGQQELDQGLTSKPNDPIPIPITNMRTK